MNEWMKEEFAEMNGREMHVNQKVYRSIDRQGRWIG